METGVFKSKASGWSFTESQTEQCAMDHGTPSVVLREAAVQDGVYFFELYRDLLRPYFEKTSGWDERFRRAAFRVGYPLTQCETIWLGCEARVGVLCVLPSTDGSIEIALLLIEPAFQQGGIGKYVLERVCADASRMRRPVRLSTFKLNEGAVRFYLRLGFTVVSEDEHYFHFRKDPGVYK
jgi:ribosomal protein S18 acetylase RimI-like enzyme